MPKQTCKTCMHARPVCAGSSTMYCGHPSLSMLQFSLYSDNKVACEFYESKGCECVKERSCKDCEHFRSYDTKPGFGKCYHISVANTVSDRTAMTCKWFSNDYNKTKSREEIEDRLKNEKEDVSDDKITQEVSEMSEVRLIDANALKNSIDSAYVVFGQCVYAKGIVDRQPTIEPEVRHGEWHECWYTDTVCASICTNCGKAATQARVVVGQELMTNVRYPLCPNCGAKMGVTDTNIDGKGGAENG